MSGYWQDNPDRHCAGLEGLYDPDFGADRAFLVNTCARGGGCPVIWECLEAAIAEGDRHTVRGALPPRCRTLVLRAKGRERLGKSDPAGTAEELLEALRVRVRREIAARVDSTPRSPRGGPPPRV